MLLLRACALCWARAPGQKTAENINKLRSGRALPEIYCAIKAQRNSTKKETLVSSLRHVSITNGQTSNSAHWNPHQVMNILMLFGPSLGVSLFAFSFFRWKVGRNFDLRMTCYVIQTEFLINFCVFFVIF